MSTVKKAVVLAAGLGTRLRPLTSAVPKPLLPVGGVAMIARIVAMLRSWGVEDIVVNCHYLHEQVEAWCAANGCRASYEPEILGTGGVLNPLREWIGKDDFYLVNGDIVVGGLEAWPEIPAAENCIAQAIVTKEGPRTIEVDSGKSAVSNWKSVRRGSEDNFTYAGIACLKADILRYVEPTGFSTIIQAYERARADGLEVVAVVPPELTWADAGTIRSYLELNRDNLGDCGIEFLGSRGSERSFYRKGENLIVLYDDSHRGENAKYVGHAKWLKAHGIRVPEVIADYPETKTSVFEWAGEERRMTESECELVMDELAKFNALGSAAADEAVALEPPFDCALYEWEVALFEQFFLGNRVTPEVRAEYDAIARVLEAEPKALVHRDFQSTNVLWRGERPYFIDFQGMRLGAAAYDVASFVCDPYVSMPTESRRSLIDHYARVSGCREIARAVPFAAVQRLTQCLGAYGRLASVGQEHFRRHIPSALALLVEAAEKAGCVNIKRMAEEVSK